MTREASNLWEHGPLPPLLPLECDGTLFFSRIPTATRLVCAPLL